MMLNRCFIFALCLTAIAMPSQAQLFEHGGSPIDQFELFNLPLDDIEFEIEPPEVEPMPEVEALIATGEDALITSIPDANTVEKNSSTVRIMDKNNNTVFHEVQVQHGWRAIQQQWLILTTTEQLTQLRLLPVTVIAADTLPLLQMHTVHIRVAADVDNLQSVIELLAPLAIDVVERHHVYDVQTTDDNTHNSHQTVVPKNKKHIVAANSAQALRIGIIDTAIDDKHSAFAQANIKTKSFIQADMKAPKAHATAVLGRLLGQSLPFAPRLSGAEIYAASVFYEKSPHAQSAPTMALLQALEWMLEQQVQVINMSLAGPPNALLAKALARVREQGIAVVAASGNAGPASRPLFPAAYDSVIAVSAVDDKQKVYRWANRGHHIDFVAQGVNVSTLKAGGGEALQSGTSMAAPVITAALALLLQSKNLPESITRLRAITIDLGAAGRDVIYGDGFIAEQSLLAL